MHITYEQRQVWGLDDAFLPCRAGRPLSIRSAWSERVARDASWGCSAKCVSQSYRSTSGNRFVTCSSRPSFYYSYLFSICNWLERQQRNRHHQTEY